MHIPVIAEKKIIHFFINPSLSRLKPPVKSIGKVTFKKAVLQLHYHLMDLLNSFLTIHYDKDNYYEDLCVCDVPLSRRIFFQRESVGFKI